MNTEQQLVALHETHGLSGEALQTWCRENGLFTYHLTSWKTAFCIDVKTATGSREIRVLKDENDRLKRELTRKEHALAKAVALLILQKKFRALWKEEVKMTSLPERDNIISLVAKAIAAGRAKIVPVRRSTSFRALCSTGRLARRGRFASRA